MNLEPGLYKSLNPLENRESILKARGRRKTETLLEMLRQDIQEEVYKVGDKIPSYDQLGETYGLNRLTVRKTLKILEQEGLVYSLPAKGTYVGKASFALGSKVKRVGLMSAIVTAETLGQHHMSIVDHLKSTLHEAGFFLQFCRAWSEPSQEDWWKSLESGDYCGLMLMGPLTQSVIEKLVRLYPLVHIDPQGDAPTVPSVCIDNFTGGKIAAEALLSRGHRKIAIILGDQACSDERLAGFRMVASKFKELDLRTYQGNFNVASGLRCAQEILAGFPQVSAVFCINDEMAAGAMQTFHERGLRVPQDISILGFDDSPIAQMVAPPLSSVGLSTKHIAKAACEALFFQIQSIKTGEWPNTSITPRLITRASLMNK